MKFLIFTLLVYAFVVSNKALRKNLKSIPIRAATWMIGVLSAIQVVYSFLPGPVWPTGPTIHPNVQDGSIPLSTFFMIQNESIIFPAHLLKVGCNVDGDFTLKSGTKVSNLAYGFSEDVMLPRDNSIPLACPVDMRLYNPRPFKMYFCVTYKPFMSFFTKHNILYYSKTFYWDNGHFSDSWTGGHWSEGANFDQDKN